MAQDPRSDDGVALAPPNHATCRNQPVQHLGPRLKWLISAQRAAAVGCLGLERNKHSTLLFCRSQAFGRAEGIRAGGMVSHHPTGTLIVTQERWVTTDSIARFSSQKADNASAWWHSEQR